MTPAEIQELRWLEATQNFQEEGEKRIEQETERMLENLERTKEDFLQMPWPTLHGLIRNIPHSRLWYVLMASGNGKTLFLHSFAEAAIAQKQAVYIMSTENTPDEYRMIMAAASAGIKPGDVSTGEYLDWPNASEITAKLRGIVSNRQVLHARLLQFYPEPGFITPAAVRKAASEAHLMGASWLIIDHVDYVDSGGSGGEIAVSNAVNNEIQKMKLKYGLRILASSQMNQDVFKKMGKMTHVSVPVEDWVKYGGVKKQNANGMIGGSRVLRSDLDKDIIKAFNAGLVPLSEVVVPGAIRLTCMKHRDHDESLGKSVVLEVHKGRIREPQSIEIASHIHGIRTNRGME